MSLQNDQLWEVPLLSYFMDEVNEIQTGFPEVIGIVKVREET